MPLPISCFSSPPSPPLFLPLSSDHNTSTLAWESLLDLCCWLSLVLVSSSMCSCVLTSPDPQTWSQRMTVLLLRSLTFPAFSVPFYLLVTLAMLVLPLSAAAAQVTELGHFGKVASFGSLFLTLPHSLPSSLHPIPSSALPSFSLSVISLLSISLFSPLSHLALSLPPSVPPSFLLSLFLCLLFSTLFN